jgi:hypothetical protein
MAGVNAPSRNETDSNNPFLARFKRATHSLPHATGCLLEIYQLQSSHSSFIVLRTALYSEVQLYVEKIHPQSLSLVETVRYIITTMQEAQYFGLDQLLDKLGAACQRAETDARQLINGYNSEAARMDNLRARIMEQKTRRFQPADSSYNTYGGLHEKIPYGTNQFSSTYPNPSSISEYPNPSNSQSPSVLQNGRHTSSRPPYVSQMNPPGSQYNYPTTLGSPYSNNMNPPVSQYSGPPSFQPPYFSQNPPAPQYVNSNPPPSNGMYSAVPAYLQTASPTPAWPNQTPMTWPNQTSMTPYGYPSTNQIQPPPQVNLDVQYGTEPNSPRRKKTNDWKKIVPNGVMSRFGSTGGSKETKANEAEEIGILESTFEVVVEAIQAMQELVQSIWGFASEVRNQVESGCFPQAPYGYQRRPEVLSYSEVLGVGKYVVEECDNLRAAKMKIWEDLHATDDEVADDFRSSWELFMGGGNDMSSPFSRSSPSVHQFMKSEIQYG